MFGVGRAEHRDDCNKLTRLHNDNIDAIDRLHERVKSLETTSTRANIEATVNTMNLHSQELISLRVDVAALKNMVEQQESVMTKVEALPKKVDEMALKVEGLETIVEGLKEENASLKERLDTSEKKIQEGEALLQRYVQAFNELLKIQKQMASNAIVTAAHSQAVMTRINDSEGRVDALVVQLEFGAIVPRNPIQAPAISDVQQEILALEEMLKARAEEAGV